MEFFDAAKLTINSAELARKKKSRYTPPSLKPTAQKIRANNITLISTNPSFSRDFLRVHSLSDYKREYSPPILTEKAFCVLEYLVEGYSTLGPTIAD